MFSSPSLLPHALILLLIFLHPSHQQPLDPKEMSVLRDIHSSIEDLPGSTFFSTWDFNSNSTEPCTSFAGIICSRDDDNFRRVSVLTLGTGLADSPGLTGFLSDSIANLTALTEIVIFPGRITGPIPPLIGTQCSRLRLISISNNLISGRIPISFGGLNLLHTLDLGYNQLTGSIPSLPNYLKVLILVSNSISGSLPNSISNSHLLHLDIGDNSFSGPLPMLPPSLRFLSATANYFSGPLDIAFSTPLPQLSYLDLSINTFTGNIPSVVFAFPKLTTVSLHSNYLSGPITLPPMISVPSWSVVDLSHNMLTGEMPVGLAAVTSLYLNDNKLTGSVPKEYARRVYNGSMTTFYAQHNFLTGLPSRPLLLPLPQSVSLCLSYNCMVAPPATEIGCPDDSGTRQSRPLEECHKMDR